MGYIEDQKWLAREQRRIERENSIYIQVSMTKELHDVICKNRGKMTRLSFVAVAVKDYFESNKSLNLTKKTDKRHTHKVQCYISCDLIKMIDERRGPVSRSAAISAILEHQLLQEAN